MARPIEVTPMHKTYLNTVWLDKEAIEGMQFQ